MKSQNWYLHAVSLIIIIAVNFLYFLPQFQGKVVQQGDIIQYIGMSKEANDFTQRTGEEALWTNSMFGGMPTYQITARSHTNLLKYVERAYQFFINRPAGTFIGGMIMFYVLMLILGVSPLLALFGAIMFGFSTNNVILYEAGHESKISSIMAAPMIIAGVYLAFRNKFLYGGVLFGLGFGINIMANHFQMTYYLGMCLLIYVILLAFKAVKKGEYISFGKSVVVLSAFGILGLGASASKLWTTYEYAKDTMRGKPVLSTTDPTSSSNVDGLAWEYAMQWSNGWTDLIASFVPKAVGGGSAEWLDKKSDFVKKVGAQSAIQVPTYWGALPFTSGPIYFGIVVVFLAVIGFVVNNGTLKWWLLSAIILTLLLSMGKNFAFFNRFIYDFFPFYNKFRTPNSILSITALFFPIMAGIAIHTLINSPSKSNLIKPIGIVAVSFSVILLILAIANSMFFDFGGKSDQNYAQIIDILKEERQTMLTSSAYRSLLFVLLCCALLYAYLKEKITAQILIIGMLVLGFVDLFQVDKNYLDKKDFVTANAYKKNFVPRSVDDQILRDKDPNFRVLDASINTFNSASTSYFHKTIGGYHAAKLQRYQDVIDRHISQNNPRVLNMLNTKYVIYPGQNDEPQLQLNPAALGNAWFVNNIIMVPNADAEIDSLHTFDPAGDVIVHQEYSDYIDNATFEKEGTIFLTEYTNNKLTYMSSSSAHQFAVFSEIWYGPNKGWKAYIDGVETPFIRVNYILRGMKIPKGEHKVEFVFEPQAYYLGEKLGFASSLIIIVMGIIALFLYVKQQNKEQTA